MKKSSLLALSLVSMVSLVGCGKPAAADPKKAMDAYVKELWGEEAIADIEYEESHYQYGVPYYVIGYLYEPNEAANPYLELCNEFYEASKAFLENMGFVADSEGVEDYPDYEQAIFAFYATDADLESKDPKATYFNELVAFSGYTEYEGSEYVFFQVEMIDLSSLLR